MFVGLNNRRTGKHATKPRALGLLGHSVSRHVAKRLSSYKIGLRARKVINYLFIYDLQSGFQFTFSKICGRRSGYESK